MDEKKSRGKTGAEIVSGPGALCSEAQADGVPCTELGRECEQCERAARHEPAPETKDRS
jgi:hypothetical protein